MKTLASGLACLGYIASINLCTAQCSFSFNLPTLISPVTQRGATLGFGMSLFGPPIGPQSKKKPNGLQLRLGGGFYYANLNNFNVYNVPLLPPAFGNTRVNYYNSITCWNAIARISLPYNKKITPYLDIFAGTRAFRCEQGIYPADAQKYGNASWESIDHVRQFSYGLSAGVLISLCPNVNMELSATYCRPSDPIKIADARSARLESGSVILNKMDLPASIPTVNIGIVLGFGNTRHGGHSTYRHSYFYHSGCRSGGHWGGGGGHCGGGHISVHIR